MAVSDRPAAMLEGLTRLLQNPSELAAMGVRARKAAEARYGWPALAERALSFYEGLFAG